jgi:hypothetical protein
VISPASEPDAAALALPKPDRRIRIKSPRILPGCQPSPRFGGGDRRVYKRLWHDRILQLLAPLVEYSSNIRLRTPANKQGRLSQKCSTLWHFGAQWRTA